MPSHAVINGHENESESSQFDSCAGQVQDMQFFWSSIKTKAPSLKKYSFFMDLEHFKYCMKKWFWSNEILCKVASCDGVLRSACQGTWTHRTASTGHSRGACAQQEGFLEEAMAWLRKRISVVGKFTITPYSWPF